ncbi:hypothetical protein bcgnr5378_62280 [Bacillus cereus]|nr:MULTISPECIES: hypothetical protein [Bacillus]MCC2341778.1 hypothetical protein [Bacillus tropicus]MCC2495076.1 hypothetical protein [Bacillus cereus]MCQ6524943.1 hypothetical protein [Bacillus paranthracis]MCU5473135.1 hypothetical protein [Bacillus paranthracis]MCU5562108.1 hypothetical protein [Bacillus pacificus]
MQPEFKEQDVKQEQEKKKEKRDLIGPLLNFGGGLLRFLASVVDKFIK